MPERNLLLLFFLLLEFLLPPCPCVISQNTAFQFPSFSPHNFTLLGDSHLRHGLIYLTRETTVPSSSSGTAVYNHPIPFSDPQSTKTASFSTRFSFSVDNAGDSSGDGLAFFLSPSDQILGSPGGFLGLVNSSQLTKNSFVAVEFDTKMDPIFDDPDDNHVGFDVESLVSIKTSNLASHDIDLKSGESITAWIDYKNHEAKLNVFLSYTALKKPETPLLALDFNLSGYVKEFMFVGFSGSTEMSTELHLIKNWSFRTYGLFLGREARNPHNVSDNSVINPPVSVPKSPKNHHKRFGLGFGIATPAFLCAFVAFLGWISVKKWKEIHSDDTLREDLVTGPRKFSYRELKLATRGFHYSRILGHGAYGTVYRADFKDSETVFAVKRSKHDTNDTRTEFTAELSIIACLRHKNLVQLQGWCVEKGELLLVYEFMPNGSLDKVLYQDSAVLEWEYRYKIATGLASVLTYLHQECEFQVIHRDIKTSNIMLDGNFNPRLGDFGLARLMDHGKSPVSTLTVGTMGYLAPEYLQYGKATEKTDVFSYGVVILELACGKRPIEREEKEDGERVMNLVDWVWGLHYQGNVVGAADPWLEGKFKDKEMKKMLLVGLSCANPDSKGRPSMRRVFQILNGDGETAVSVPRMKPSLNFDCRLSVQDVVSDDDDDEEEEECCSVEHRIEINGY